MCGRLREPLTETESQLLNRALGERTKKYGKYIDNSLIEKMSLCCKHADKPLAKPLAATDPVIQIYI